MENVDGATVVVSVIVVLLILALAFVIARRV